MNLFESRILILMNLIKNFKFDDFISFYFSSRIQNVTKSLNKNYRNLFSAILRGPGAAALLSPY